MFQYSYKVLYINYKIYIIHIYIILPNIAWQSGSRNRSNLFLALLLKRSILERILTCGISRFTITLSAAIVPDKNFDPSVINCTSTKNIEHTLKFQSCNCLTNFLTAVKWVYSSICPGQSNKIQSSSCSPKKIC